MKLTVVTHVDFEGPAGIGEWALRRGCELEVIKPYAGDPLPHPRAVEMLAVMGGPMSVHDEQEHPWLVAERAFLGQAVEAGVPMVGVCLGAQLLAMVLGADVYRNAEPEIGFHPVAMSAQARALDLFNGWPAVFEALHWHGDTFAIPHGAVPLASSEATANQGFAYQNKIVGLQFHIEATPGSWDELMSACAHEVDAGGRYVQSCEEMKRCYDRMKPFPSLLAPFLDALAEQVN